METALKAIESSIASTKSMIDYYQKESDKNLAYKKSQEEKLVTQEADYKQLRSKLGLETETV